MKPSTLIAFTLFATLGGACAKTEIVPPTAPPTAPIAEEEAPAVEEAPAEAEAPGAAEARAKAEAEAEAAAQAERIAQVQAEFAEAQAAAAAEKARFTPALEAKVAKLTSRKFPNRDAALKAILAAPHRTPGNAARDKYRHPAKTLAFFGIKPDMTVVEVGAGEGWYTEILAPLVAKQGQLYAVTYDPEGPADSMATVYGKRLQMFLDKSPAAYGKVELVAIAPPEKLELGGPGTADMALAIREMHNWQRRGLLDAYLAAIHAVLKDGGVLGVVQHRAPEGAEAEAWADKGYLPEAWLIEKIEAAGFELADKSDINANPKDTKDHEKGVWALPPSYAGGDTDKAKFTAIGESDRMTLKFVKVAE